MRTFVQRPCCLRRVNTYLNLTLSQATITLIFIKTKHVSWDSTGKKQKSLVFSVLPFGLCTAPYVFTKLMRPLIRLWRGRGLKAIIYLDDGIVSVKGEQQAIEASAGVRSDLEKAGFVVNLEKSMWVPSHAMEWLDFQINLDSGTFSVAPVKIEALRAAVHNLMRLTPWVPARQLGSVIGKIIAMSLGLGPVTRLMTHCLYSNLNKKTSWCQRLCLTGETLQELEFWAQELANFNGQSIWPKPSAVRVTYSDASASGYGGYIVEHGTNSVCNIPIEFTVHAKCVRCKGLFTKIKLYSLTNVVYNKNTL